MNAKSKLQLIQFNLDDMSVCAELKYINKVLLLPALEKVPGSPHYVAGLMNVAGASVLVVDLLLCLNLERKNLYTLDTPILLCQSNSRMFGLIVDNVVGLAEIEETDMQMKDELTAADSIFIASIPLNSKLSLMVNIPKLLNGYLQLDNRKATEIAL